MPQPLELAALHHASMLEDTGDRFLHPRQLLPPFIILHMNLTRYWGLVFPLSLLQHVLAGYSSMPTKIACRIVWPAYTAISTWERTSYRDPTSLRQFREGAGTRRSLFKSLP